MRNRALLVAVGVLVVALLGGLVAVFYPSAATRTLTAHFTRTVGLYAGADVRILGVPVGTVTTITPEGTSVRVEMHYDADQRVPANAQAVIVPPSLVSDRYVALTPVYTGGPVLADGANLPLARTSVPVELDAVLASLDNLSTALGPNGANSNGALSDLIKVGAANLGGGNGTLLRTTISQLADLVTTLDTSKGDLVATVGHLADFTTALANDNSGVLKVSGDLAQASRQLDAERGELTQAVRNLAVALGEVTSFIGANKAELTANINGLADVTGVLVKEKRSLTEFLDVAPLALQNLGLAFDPVSQTLLTRANLLDALPANQATEAVCGLLQTLGSTLGAQLGPQCGTVPSPPLLGGAGVGSVDKTLGGLLGGHR